MSEANRKARRLELKGARRHAKRAAVAGATVATTSALALGLSTPNAEAAVAPYYPIAPTGGPLINLLPALGITGVNIPVLGYTTLAPVFPSADNLYRTINGMPFVTDNPKTVCSAAPTSDCRLIPTITSGIGTFGATEAVRGLVESIQGKTPDGQDPLRPGTTISAFLPINNLLRPNGGIAARFPDITKALGLNPELVPNDYFENQAGDKALSNLMYDTTWQYNTLADFPAVANPLAMLNSAMAVIPNLEVFQGGIDEILGRIQTSYVAPDGTTLNYQEANILGLGFPFAGADAGISRYYLTAPTPNLPLLSPMTLPTQAANLALNALGSPYLLGNPVADAIEPALKILVNIGYTDVLAPDQLNERASNVDPFTKTWAELGYQAYDRTLFKSDITTPFGSAKTLTPEEMAKVPSDVWAALVKGIQDQFQKPFWGILVPNPKDGAVSGATVSASAPSATSGSVGSNGSAGDNGGAGGGATGGTGGSAGTGGSGGAGGQGGAAGA